MKWGEIEALTYLKTQILDRNELLDAHIHRTSYHNSWFTKENYWKRLEDISRFLLDEEKLLQWVSRYRFPVNWDFAKTVGVIFSGNIPLAGFYDFLTVYLSGHQAKIKLAAEDPYVFSGIINILKEVDTDLFEKVKIVEQLQDFDAVVAEGSEKKYPYYVKYFGNYPSVIHKTGTSVAILDGKERRAELKALASDIMEFFGMDPRSVTKIFVPRKYDFTDFLLATEPFSGYANHHKYKNNFDYYLSIDLLNHVPIISNSYLNLKAENDHLISPVGTLYYEEYDDVIEIQRKLKERRSEIQAVVGHYGVENLPLIPFGETRQVDIFDYSTNADLGHFLFEISCKT